MGRKPEVIYVAPSVDVLLTHADEWLAAIERMTKGVNDRLEAREAKIA